MVDPARLRAAYQTARDALLAERTPEGYWVGELSTSALSTAVAAIALHLVDAEKHRPHIAGGIRWLATRTPTAAGATPPRASRTSPRRCCAGQRSPSPGPRRTTRQLLTASNR